VHIARRDRRRPVFNPSKEPGNELGGAGGLGFTLRLSPKKARHGNVTRDRWVNG
jgi:hypothetical protein